MQVAGKDAGATAFGWSALEGVGYRVLGRSRSPARSLSDLTVLSETSLAAFEAQRVRNAERLALRAAGG